MGHLVVGVVVGRRSPYQRSRNQRELGASCEIGSRNLEKRERKGEGEEERRREIKKARRKQIK